MKFKHLLIALAAVAITLGLSGCAKQGSNQFVGKWHVQKHWEKSPDSPEGFTYINDSDGIDWELKSNGKLVTYQHGKPMSDAGFWSYDEETDELTIGLLCLPVESVTSEHISLHNKVSTVVMGQEYVMYEEIVELQKK